MLNNIKNNLQSELLKAIKNPNVISMIGGKEENLSPTYVFTQQYI